MCPHQNFLTQVGSAIFGLGLENIAPKNPKFYKKISLGVKKYLFGSGQKVTGSKSGRPLIYSVSKEYSSWVGLRPISIVK